MADIQTKIAKQKSKGAPRAGDASDRGGLPTKATRCYETNPATGKGSSDRGTPSQGGKKL